MNLASEILAVMLGTVAFAECLVRCPLMVTVRSASEVARKSLRVVSSRRISDHWKEAVLPRYSGQQLVTSCLVGFWLMVCVAAFMIVFGLTRYLLGGKLTLVAAVPSVFDTVVASVFGVLYGLGRAKHAGR